MRVEEWAVVFLVLNILRQQGLDERRCENIVKVVSYDFKDALFYISVSSVRRKENARLGD